MRGLSNFFHRHAPLDDDVRIRRVERSETHAALKMMLGSQGRSADEHTVLDFMHHAIARKLVLDDIHVVDAQGKIRWAAMGVAQAGATMLVLAPDTVNEKWSMAAEELVQKVCRDSARAGIELGQVLLDKDRQAARNLYERCGFALVAELVYLQTRVAPAMLTESENRWSWDTYSPQTHGLFRQTILQSYEQSLDCPRLNGMRDIERVIEGHRGTGIFDPSLWFVLRDGARAMGVMLLSVIRPDEVMELVYLGLTPDARGQGLGDVMMRHALTTAQRYGARQLTLAVDAENHPAKKLYFRHGFGRIGTKLALIRDLRAMREISTGKRVGPEDAPRPITAPNVDQRA